MNCVYSFFTKDTQECVYVGSTKCFWRRYGQHLKDSYESKQQFKIYNLIFKIGGWDNIEYRILEQNLEEKDLLLREKHWYLELKPSGNRQSPLQTPEERAIQIKNKNKERTLKTIVCDCGSKIPDYPSNIQRHLLTIKHQTWLSFP